MRRFLKNSHWWYELSCIGLKNVFGLLSVVVILGLVAGVLMATGCRDRSTVAAPPVEPTGIFMTRGGNIDLPSGRKLVNFGYKNQGYTPWILTRAMHSEEKAETYYFHDDDGRKFVILEHVNRDVEVPPADRSN